MRNLKGFQISKEQLKTLYIDKGMKQKEIADMHNVKIYQVQNALVKYKINKKTKPKNHLKHWTKEQDKYLIEKFGILSYESIGKSKIIQRTAESVRARAAKLELGDPRFCEDFISKTFLSNTIKADAKSVNDWIKNKGLKADKKILTLKVVITRIKLSNFWKWAKKHTYLINWNRFECEALGVEPKWAKKVREEYKKITPVNEGKEWTNEQDSLLDSLYRLGKTTKEIAKELGRSESGVDRRLSVICVERRKKRWTKEEELKVKKMLKEGKGTYEISIKLNRPYKSVEMFRTRYINANKSVTY